MALSLKHGVTNALIAMVYDRLVEHRSYAEVTQKLGKEGIARQLDRMEWAVGVYLDNMCIAALWGDDEMRLVTRRGYETQWVSPAVFRQFWRWFFEGHEKAIVKPDNGFVIPFLLRTGFRWDEDKLVLSPHDLKMAV